MPGKAASTETWNAGSDTWNQGGDDTGTIGYDWSGNVWNGGNNIANFTGTPGTVTVDDSGLGGPVTFDYLNFNDATAGSWDVTGDALTKYSYTDGSSTGLVAQMGAGQVGNVTIDSAINLDDTQNHYFNITDGSTSGASLTINGNITLVSSATTPLNPLSGMGDTVGTGHLLYIDGNFGNIAAKTDVINLNSAISVGTSGNTLGVVLGNDNHTTSNPSLTVYNLGTSFDLTGLGTGSSSGTDLAINGGTVYTSSSKLGSGAISFQTSSGSAAIITQTRALLTVGAQTITNNIYNSAKANTGLGTSTIGGSDAATSTFSGQVSLDSTSMILTAAAGGRDIFSGNFVNDSPNGLSKTGAGTVVMSGANTYGVFGDFSGTNQTPATSVPAGSVAMDVKQGTLLIANTTGSAFGNSATSNVVTFNGTTPVSTITPVTVNVEAGATLGGTGTVMAARQVVQAMAGTSVISPGDSGLGTIGTLHLLSGLTTTSTAGVGNGLTMDFKLNGTGANDMLDLGAGALTLNGAIDINFSNIGGALASTPYTFITGTGTWSGTPTFDIVAPTGYVLDTSYGTNGYLFDTTGGADSFSVEFTAAPTPEPSTWALMGLGALVFFGARKLRRRDA